MNKNYIRTNPALRLRESSSNDIRDNIEGILVGFSRILKDRDGWIDIITTSLARREILELIIAVAKDPEMLKEVKNDLKESRGLAFVNEIIEVCDN